MSPRQLSLRQSIPRQLSPQQLIHVNLHWDHLSHFRGGGGGGGKGVHPDFFVKLEFEITVDQQTKANVQNFEGVPNFGSPPVSAGQPGPYLVNYWLHFTKSPKHTQNHALGCSTCS